ncbi:MAG: gamma-glutamyltransferase [Rhodocyclaceae bacterium]|nr:gamma-glutamyltransferase [Rhodocyclaceae bacterium]
MSNPGDEMPAMRLLALIPAICAVVGLTACTSHPMPAVDVRAQPERATDYRARPAARGERMVVTAHELATRAALEMLDAGGSAVDGAIAAQWVLGLVEPQSSGPAGGGFLLHFEATTGRLRFFDGRERAPAAALPERFLDASGRPLPFWDAAASGLSVGVPGLPAMLEVAHRAGGRLPWPRLFEPAIRLARTGYPLSPRLHALLAAEPALATEPGLRTQFFREDGQVRAVGSMLTNHDYAELMESLANGGAHALYQGDIAADIVRAVRSHARPGDLTIADLTAYRPEERAPLCGMFRSYRVCGAPPPSSGGVVVLALLGIMQRFPPDAEPMSARFAHRFAEAGRLAFADRAQYLADPDQVSVPVKALTDPDYLRARATRIDEARSMGVALPGTVSGSEHTQGHTLERPSTTHLSIVDREGNAVALTSSIEAAFGSRIWVRGTLLNNQLTDFSFMPMRDGRQVANRVAPGKRPLSSMSPTMVFDGQGRLLLVLGSPGGSRIPNYVARTILAILDSGMGADAALGLPHIGSRNGPTELEAGRAEALRDPLVARGHRLLVTDMTSGLHVIQRMDAAGPGWRLSGPDNPTPDVRPASWLGAADPRREGVASSSAVLVDGPGEPSR